MDNKFPTSTSSTSQTVKQIKSQTSGEIFFLTLFNKDNDKNCLKLSLDRTIFKNRQMQCVFFNLSVKFSSSSSSSSSKSTKLQLQLSIQINMMTQVEINEKYFNMPKRKEEVLSPSAF